MTAPDVNADVRARFEASMRQLGLAEHMFRRSPVVGLADCYYEPSTRGAWAGYRAAHADLSGEVRELVDADREYDEADAGLARKGDGPLTKRLDRYNAAEKRRAAALAKFAHPHQCAGDSE